MTARAIAVPRAVRVVKIRHVASSVRPSRRVVPHRARTRPNRAQRALRHRSRRASARRWQQRGKRGQVSAIVTILGLLLVVSMIANYISTTLPAEMRVNDANRNIQVENEIARISALMQAVSRSGAVGSVLNQPINLASAGLPPFAAPDAGSISQLSTGGGASAVNFTVVGPIAFIPFGGWPAGGNLYGASGCMSAQNPNPNPTVITCSGSSHLVQNLTNGSHYINGVGGANFTLQITTNWSTVDVNTSGGLYVPWLNFSGSHDIISVTYTGGATANMFVYGNWDNISVGGKGGGTIVLTLVGNHDKVTWTDLGTSSTFKEVAYGSYDSLVNSANKPDATVTYVGFDAQNASSKFCPYGTDALTDTAIPNPSGGTVHYQVNSTGYVNKTNSSGGWTNYFNNTPLTASCPFFSKISVPFLGKGAVAGAFAVHAANSYVPTADIAFDNGALVYAQPGGIPVMLSGPGITLVNGRLSLWFPQFASSLGAEQGVGIASVGFRLSSVFTLYLPVGNFNISTGTDALTIAIKTPFAQAWVNYFKGQGSFVDTAKIKCTPAASAPCTGGYVSNGKLGVVTIPLNLPAGTTMNLQVATFQVYLH